MIKSNYLFVIFGLLVLSSCKNDDAVPAYLHLTEWQFSTESDQGTSNQLIGAAHVFVDGKSIGVYQVPNTIAIVGDGVVDIDVFPMVKNAGIKDWEIIMPYFEPIDTQLTLEPIQEDTLLLTTRYRDQTEFVIIEDFEGRIGFNDDIDGDDGTKIERSNIDVFEGNSCGRFVVNEDHPILESGWETALTNSLGHGEYWIEINYKTNITLRLGVLAFINGAGVRMYHGAVKPKDEWNKIYFNFTDEFTSAPTGVFEMVIVGLWSEDLNIVEGEVFIDNVKLLRTK